jgi:hypothetical protein
MPGGRQVRRVVDSSGAGSRRGAERARAQVMDVLQDEGPRHQASRQAGPGWHTEPKRPWMKFYLRRQPHQRMTHSMIASSEGRSRSFCRSSRGLAMLSSC